MNTLLVLALIPQLGSDDFKTRTLAQHKLEKLLPVAGPYLVMVRGHSDPEIAARAGTLADQWTWQIAESIKPATWPYLPWIDSLPHGYPNRHALIAEYLNIVDTSVTDNPGGPPHWPRYRHATKFYVRTLLLDGMTLSEVTDLLDKMAIHEKCWIKSHQHGFTFPKEMLAACD